MTGVRPKVRGLLAVVMVLLPATGRGAAPEASPEEGGRFGFALNTSFNSEVTPLRLVPSATCVTGKSQLELGFGIHPFIRKEQRVLSGEFNYKYFPNAWERPLSPYLIGRFSYVNSALETYYATAYSYLFLNGGYGLVLSGNGRTYLGTNVAGGLFTYARKSENPYPGFEKDGLFGEVGVNVAFQFDVGWRF